MPIQIEHVDHCYMQGTRMSFRALTDIDLTIREGEFLGIIGHTGSGKSTLMQHLNGLLLPTSGRVLVDGLDTSDKKQRIEARRLVGMVFQYPEYQLFEETVKKDVAFGPRNAGLSEEESFSRAIDAMRLVGLDPDRFAEQSPFDLSGGEKRRAALAGILAMRPRYLVLDEPMAGLDPAGRRNILELVEKLRREEGTTIVMVSHSMDDIAAAADRVLALDHGKAALLDTPEKVFAEPERLAGMGLNVPTASRIAALLREKGMPVRPGICRMNDLRDAILEVCPHGN